MSNSPGFILYKCRCCGTVFESGVHVPEIHRALWSQETPDALPGEWGGLCYTTTHTCKDGRIGLGDICGGKPDKET